MGDFNPAYHIVTVRHRFPQSSVPVRQKRLQERAISQKQRQEEGRNFLRVKSSVKKTTPCIYNFDGAPITSQTHTHPSHSQTSGLLTSSLSLGVPVSRANQCMRGV
jgi:hypothetical protein